MTNDQMNGRLGQVRAEIMRKRGWITDDDVTEAGGDMEKLIGEIQQRSGERREAIGEWLKAKGID